MNTGTVALPIMNITFTGPNHGQFSKTTTCGTSLAPGTSGKIKVSFKSTTTGDRKENLDFNRVDGAGTKRVATRGSGL